MNIICLGADVFKESNPNWNTLTPDERKKIVEGKINEIDSWITTISSKLKLSKGSRISMYIFDDKELQLT